MKYLADRIGITIYTVVLLLFSFYMGLVLAPQKKYSKEEIIEEIKTQKTVFNCTDSTFETHEPVYFYDLFKNLDLRKKLNRK